MPCHILNGRMESRLILGTRYSPYQQLIEHTGAEHASMSDHTVSQSLYLMDPDRNEVELYLDADESVWKNNPTAVMSPMKPLRL